MKKMFITGETINPIENYLAYCRVERRLSTRTLAIYQAALEQLQSHCVANQIQVLEVQPLTIRHLTARMRIAGHASNGIALHLSSWRGFFRWAGRQGWIKSDPTADVRPPKKEKPLPKALSVDQAQQLADYVPPQPNHNPWLIARDHAMVELLYGCGMRVSELTGLDRVARPQSKGWLDLDAGLAFVTGKGNKSRSIPMGRKAITAVQDWLGQTAPVCLPEQHLVPLFVGINGTRLTAQSIWLRLRKWGQSADMPNAVHPHMLRHSFASHLLQSSGDLRAVQELLGHANISTTQIYTRLNFQHLSTTYDAAHPRAKRP